MAVLEPLIQPRRAPGVFAGRTFADAPDIDGTVYVEAEGIEPGDIAPVVIVARQDYDLVGVVASED